ncbi:MAG: MinD/ParA family protein [Nanoarchaeota archaeon]
MSKTLGIISIKGGVGKTSVASSLATDLVNNYGKRVLLVDANYSAPNLGLHMDIVEPEKTIHEVLAGKVRIESAIHSKYGVDVIPGSYSHHGEIDCMKLKDRISKIKSNYDYVVIDSSPNLNDEVLSAMVASDALFVVTTPDYPTLSCSLKAAELARNRGKPIAGLILNKIRNPDYEMSIREIEEISGIAVVAKIPDEEDHVKSVFTRIPMTLYNSRSKFSKEINDLSGAVTGEKKSLRWFHKLLPLDLKREKVNREVMKQKFYNSVFSNKIDLSEEMGSNER